MEKSNSFFNYKNIATLAVSCFLSLLVLEIGVRLFIPQDKKITWIEMHERGFVMNQKGGNTFHEFENRRAEYQFTEYRTRGNNHVDTAIDSTNINILTYGDSFTFGLLLQQEDTYVAHLQNWADSSLSSNVQFYNAAVGGAGMADWPAWLEQYGHAINPDKIIYFINHQDVFRALSKNLYVFDESNEPQLTVSQRWKPRSFFQDLATNNWYRSLQANSEVMNIVVKLLWRNFFFEDLTDQFSPESSKVLIPKTSQFSIDDNYSLSLSIALIQKMQNWCEINNCELILTNTGFFDENLYDPHTFRLHEYLINSQDFEYLDLEPCVSKASNSDFTSIQIPNDSHPNEAGAKFISDCLIEPLSFVLNNQ